MSLWILDTDHVSFVLSGDPVICDRVIRNSANVAITIITVQEVFNGWITRINSPAEADNLVILYTRLCIALDFFKSVQVLNFDQLARDHYDQLLQQNPLLNKKRLHKDMRISAIALSVGGAIVTRNNRDFGLVPGLSLEDWTS
jgi:tRNA(fMet)-specific endonuclease VapC